ncbi:hypothetical protein [Streptomyces cadmiisoli]|nr:hypothetical protein [Streptomyces cadmiisoli]
MNDEKSGEESLTLEEEELIEEEELQDLAGGEQNKIKKVGPPTR